MILPVVAYGHPILRKVCDNITPQYDGLEKLLADMWETMYASKGVGIAAPQINKAIRLFLVDTEQLIKDFDDDDRVRFANEKPIKSVFINAKKIEEIGKSWPYNEGCLSIPRVREDVTRKETIRIKYLDENFNEQEGEFDGITGRVILHEYDHIEGKLFIDLLSPLKRRLIKKRLDDISSGKIKMDYRMIFAK
jgi:peptide deformylase